MRAFQVRHGARSGFKLRSFAVGANGFAQSAGQFFIVGRNARLGAASGERGDTGELQETTAWVFRHPAILSYFEFLMGLPGVDKPAIEEVKEAIFGAD